MKVTVLGAGGVFATMERGHSAFLVEVTDRKILIDCGGTVPFVLRDEMGIPLQDITDIIITHAHGDHLSGLETLLYSNKYLGKVKPNLYAHREVWHSVHDMLVPSMCYTADGAIIMKSFFNKVVTFKTVDECADVGGLPLRIQRVLHVADLPASRVRLGALAISGDTHRPEIEPSGEITHWFHEAEFGFATRVHCPVALLDAETPDFVKPHMWLYHCPADADHGEFAGVLKKGDVFDLTYTQRVDE